MAVSFSKNTKFRQFLIRKMLQLYIYTNSIPRVGCRIHYYTIFNDICLQERDMTRRRTYSRNIWKTSDILKICTKIYCHGHHIINIFHIKTTISNYTFFDRQECNSKKIKMNKWIDSLLPVIFSFKFRVPV